MTPNEKELLEKTAKLVEENNHILKGIRSSNRWASAFRVFYWVIIIGISVGAFYYIQPYIDVAFKAYKSVSSDLNNVKSVVNKVSSKIN